MKSSIEKRYFTITEVAQELDLKPSMLRYWEKEFRQLNPRTNSRGKRFYTRKDIDLIVEIRRLVKEERFTIDGARKILDKGGQQVESTSPGQSQIPFPSGHAVNNAAQEEVVSRLERLREQLLALKAGQAANASEHNPESLTQAW
jgi:DNA-binding transcriptional MerR regulator